MVRKHSPPELRPEGPSGSVGVSTQVQAFLKNRRLKSHLLVGPHSFQNTRRFIYFFLLKSGLTFFQDENFVCPIGLRKPATANLEMDGDPMECFEMDPFGQQFFSTALRSAMSSSERSTNLDASSRCFEQRCQSTLLVPTKLRQLEEVLNQCECFLCRNIC